jgi:hypothetical protein
MRHLCGEQPMKAPLPENETERLAALRGLGILDTPPELAYDELCALAAYICQAPIALISFVDEDRQWFKSRVGWTNGKRVGTWRSARTPSCNPT